MKKHSIAFVMLAAGFLTCLGCSTPKAHPQAEIIRLHAGGTGPYAVSIRMAGTPHFTEPRNAVYNYLGKDIDGYPLALTVADASTGREVTSIAIRSVPLAIKNDPQYGHVFDNAGILEIKWSGNGHALALRVTERRYRQPTAEHVLLFENAHE